jgi:molybdenum cofactor biosynthesis enzyme MoaA
LDFRFTTNGYIMSEDMARRFIAAGLFNIGVSLESLDPTTNEIIRPHPEGTAKTIRCIDLLLKERDRQKKHLSINVKTVLTEINMESFLDIVKRYGKIEGMMCTPQMFEPMDGMPQATKDLLYIKDIDRLQRMTDEIRKLKREGYAIHARARQFEFTFSHFLRPALVMGIVNVTPDSLFRRRKIFQPGKAAAHMRWNSSRKARKSSTSAANPRGPARSRWRSRRIAPRDSGHQKTRGQKSKFPFD